MYILMYFLYTTYPKVVVEVKALGLTQVPEPRLGDKQGHHFYKNT